MNKASGPVSSTSSGRVTARGSGLRVNMPSFMLHPITVFTGSCGPPGGVSSVAGAMAGFGCSSSGSSCAPARGLNGTSELHAWGCAAADPGAQAAGGTPAAAGAPAALPGLLYMARPPQPPLSALSLVMVCIVSGIIFSAFPIFFTPSTELSAIAAEPRERRVELLLACDSASCSGSSGSSSNDTSTSPPPRSKPTPASPTHVGRGGGGGSSPSARTVSGMERRLRLYVPTKSCESSMS